MKKFLALLLAVVMVASLAACGSSDTDTTTAATDAATTASGEEVTGSEETTAPEAVPVVDNTGKELTELVQASTWGISTWCLFNCTNKPGFYINFYEPLINADNYNMAQPGLAESWSANEDESVWTFNIRKGVKWVDYQGNEVGEVTPEDWLYGLEWVLNFWKNDSYQTTIPISVIKGAKEYYEYTQNLSEDEAWDIDLEKFKEMVGIEVTDDTVTYTCLSSCPYFESVAECIFMFPLAKGQLDAVGGARAFKSVGPFDLWCCGPYLPETYVEDNSWSCVPNPTYWNADNTKVFERVTIIKVESTDMAYQLFESGELNYPMDLSTSTITTIWNDPTNEWHDYLAKKADTGVSWGLFFNYAKNNADGTPDTNWNTAAANENFRKCFYYGLDFYNYLAYIDPIDPESAARGTMTVAGLCTLSDGTDYTELVYDLIDYHPSENYSRQDSAKFEEAKKAATEELTAAGVTFPIQIEMWTKSDQTNVDKYTLMKEIIEDALGTDFVQVNINTVVTSKQSEVYDPSLCSLELQGYGALFADPTTFLNQMRTDVGGNGEWADLYGHISECTNQEVVDEFDTFTEMVNKANEITGDHDARYEALAEAEAYALEHVLCIPTHTPATREITPVNTYSKIAAINDTQATRYINWETYEDYYTMENIADIKAQHYGN